MNPIHPISWLTLPSLWPHRSMSERQLIDSLAMEMFPDLTLPAPIAPPSCPAEVRWWSCRWHVWENHYTPVLRAATEADLVLVDLARNAALDYLLFTASRLAQVLADPDATSQQRAHALEALLDAADCAQQGGDPDHEEVA